MEAIHDRNLSGSDIRDHLRDEERIKLRTHFLTSVVVAYFFLECMYTTDTGAKNNTDSVQVFFFYIKTGVCYRFFGNCNGVLSVQIHFPCLFTIDIFRYIEVFHFACELGLE